MCTGIGREPGIADHQWVSVQMPSDSQEGPDEP